MRHGKRLGETFKLPKLSRVSGASMSRPASRKLQRFVSVSSRSRPRRSRAHPCYWQPIGSRQCLSDGTISPTLYSMTYRLGTIPHDCYVIMRYDRLRSFKVNDLYVIWKPVYVTSYWWSIAT